MTPEEFHKRVRTEIIPVMAGWTPEELARLLSRLPERQRTGWTKMIEDHQRNQK